MAHTQRYKIPIPKNLRIYYQEMSIAGLNYRKHELVKLIKRNTAEFILENEPENPYDKNAIKVIAKSKGIIFTKTIHLGYIPKEIAKEINHKKLNNKLIPRLKEIWLGDRGGANVVVDLLGDKSSYSNYF